MLWSADDCPSPKFQLYEYGGVPPVAFAVKLTVRGASPEVGEAIIVCLIAGLVLTEMLTVTLAFADVLSVTVKVAI